MSIEFRSVFQHPANTENTEHERRGTENLSRLCITVNVSVRRAVDLRVAAFVLSSMDETL